MAVSKPLLTEFGIHHRLESCAYLVQKDLLSALDGFEQSVHVGQIVVDLFVHHWAALCVQDTQVVTHHPLLTLRRDFAERARVEKLSAPLVLRLDALYHLVQS